MNVTPRTPPTGPPPQAAAVRHRTHWPVVAMLAAVALAAAAHGQADKEDPSVPVVQSSQGADAILNNGSGDGRAVVTVAPLGGFRSLEFDPVGAHGPSGTTFFSAVYCSNIGSPPAGGQGPPPGAFLVRATAPTVEFQSVTASRATSVFTLDAIEFSLVQEMLPASPTGSTFRQTYTIINRRKGLTPLDLIRHFDGDLSFDASISDIGAVAPRGQQLYELDSNEDPDDPTTFVGVDLNGTANLGFRIAQFRFTDTILALGRDVLDNTLTRDGKGSNDKNADENGDFVTDQPYDVTLLVDGVAWPSGNLRTGEGVDFHLD